MNDNFHGNDYNDYWHSLRASSKYHPANRFRYYYITKLLKSYCPLDAPKVLDLGCGDGELLRHVAGMFPSCQLVGADISAEQIKRNTVNHPDMEFFTFDAGASELPQILRHKFDIVLSSEVIEHIPNDDNFISNICELLKEDGVMLLSTQSGRMFRMDLEVLGHLRAYEPAGLKPRLEAKGLRVLTAFKTGFPVLSLQKRMVDLLFERVVKSFARGEAPGTLGRLMMTMMYQGMIWCRRLPFGPQLFIIGKRIKHDMANSRQGREAS
jgi:2-polyprenyl-3-methyl-5-hydroxy-6-metoxy-1,4-benzoquinol methylase